MKIIYPDRTDSVYAPSESAGYDSSRLLNDHPRKYWKAATNAASVFQLLTDYPGNAAGLSYTNALYLDFFTYSDTTTLITNGSFETAGGGGADVFASWTETASDGAIADEGTIVYAGNHAAKLTAGAGVNTIIQQEITTGFTVGKRLKIAFFARGDGDYGGRYQVEYYDGSYHDLIATTATKITGTTYTYVANSAYIPAGTTKLRITLWCPSTNAGIAYFDYVSVVEHSQFIEYDLYGIDDILEFMLGEAKDMPLNTWVDYTLLESSHTIEWAFTGTVGVNVYCGIVRAGLALEFRNPQYGLVEDRKDYSNTVRSYGGSLLTNYNRTKHLVRQFNGQMFVERDRDFYVFADYIAGSVGPTPVMVLITDTNTLDWCVFGGFSVGIPSGGHISNTHSTINFTLIEEK